MKKNNLIRFLESLILLPIITVSMPFGNFQRHLSESLSVSGVYISPQFVLPLKENIESHDLSSGLLAFNQAMDQKAQILKMQAEAIDAYFALHDMPLRGMGRKMAEEAANNDLDWRLLPAIAVRESTGGKFECKKADHNPFGWGSCKISFNSNEEAIKIVARNLGGNNPNTDHHYAGKTTKQILRKYNPPSVVPRYAEQVMAIMNKIGLEDIIPNTPASSSDLLAQTG